jgi:hypothetical protein
MFQNVYLVKSWPCFEMYFQLSRGLKTKFFSELVHLVFLNDVYLVKALLLDINLVKALGNSLNIKK